MILDASCGNKTTWFNKNINEQVVFLDHRVMKPMVLPNGRNWAILPNVQAKWKCLPFKDSVFSCVYWDPPHILARRKKDEKMVMKIAYDVLEPWNWRETLLDAVKEFVRVLKPDGVLILKWNETSKSLEEALSCFPLTPLFGTTTNHNSRHSTWFVVFQNNKQI